MRDTPGRRRAGPIKQSRCIDLVLICTSVMKIRPGPKTCLQLVLFDKAFPSSCQRKLCKLKCYEAAKRVPSANPTQWRNDLPTAQLSVEA
jgi:hypothetical protein